MSRPEKYYVSKLQSALKAMGAKVIKHHGSAYSSAGEPDLIACLEGRTIVIEVKRDGEKATPLQEKRLQEWRDAGALALVSVGEDWRDVVEVVVQCR